MHHEDARKLICIGCFRKSKVKGKKKSGATIQNFTPLILQRVEKYILNKSKMKSRIRWMIQSLTE
jgi:hypothetical protein